MQTATVTAQLIPPATVTEPVSSPATPRRVEWLDGIRGAAALFVVLHHTWLSVWPAFPRNIGPWWVGWLLYGHLAVAVFIVVSGFSLSLAPIRRGDTVSGGARRFLRRRGWRIIPPYWAALIISTLISWLVLQPSLATGTVTRGFVVHGLMLQDITGSWVPNGAFWSIAVEWQIYFVFPLILWLARRTSIRMSVVSTVALVLAVEVDDHPRHPVQQDQSPHASVPGAVRGRRPCGARRTQGARSEGSAANSFIRARDARSHRDRSRRRRLGVDGEPLLLGRHRVRVRDRMRDGRDVRGWSGEVASPACVAANAATRPVLVQRLSLARPARWSHGPGHHRPLHLAPLVGFALLLTVGVPLILVVCYGFHLVFEAPFLHRRDAGALREMPIFGKLFRPRGRVAAPSTGRPASPSTAREADVVAIRESTA